jgi:hypothetical protein
MLCLAGPVVELVMSVTCVATVLNAGSLVVGLNIVIPIRVNDLHSFGDASTFCMSN